MRKLNEIKNVYRQHSSGDAWGDAMSAGFALCEILYLRDEHDIPELMQFRPSPMGVMLNEECPLTAELNHFETKDLEAFGVILNRLIDILKACGKDY